MDIDWEYEEASNEISDGTKDVSENISEDIPESILEDVQKDNDEGIEDTESYSMYDIQEDVQEDIQEEEKGPSLSFQPDREIWWQKGLNAIEENVDALHDDYLDKGYEDGPELEAILAQERKNMLEELSRDFGGN